MAEPQLNFTPPKEMKQNLTADDHSSNTRTHTKLLTNYKEYTTAEKQHNEE
jgi:hypothetical protein